MADGAKELCQPLAMQPQLRSLITLIADVQGSFRAIQLLGQTTSQGCTGLKSRRFSVMTQALQQPQLRDTLQRPTHHNAVLNLHRLMPP